MANAPVVAAAGGGDDDASSRLYKAVAVASVSSQQLSWCSLVLL